MFFFWDGIGWNLYEFVQRKSRWVTVISDDLDEYVLGSKLPLFPYNRGWSSAQRVIPFGHR